jgi:hypothetical protein
MDSPTLDRFVGTYLIGSCGILSITRDGEQLYAQMSGQPNLPIYPETPPKFRWRTINAQVTFAIDNGRPATSATIHQGGGEVMATRLDETATRAIEAKLANRIREQLPLPGSEAAVQKFFADVKTGTPNYGDMTDALREVVRRQLPALAAKAQGIQSVRFKGVSEVGADNYIVTYHDGQQSHCLIDLDSGGKIALLALLPKFSYL